MFFYYLSLIELYNMLLLLMFLEEAWERLSKILLYQLYLLEPEGLFLTFLYKGNLSNYSRNE
jgi:hypothetical protein